MQIHAYTVYVLFTAYTKLLYMKPGGTVINKGLKPRPKRSQRGSSWTKLGRPLKSRGSNPHHKHVNYVEESEIP